MFEDGAPVKCNPLAFWEFRDCFNYTEANGLDIHPLHAEVGCRRPIGFASFSHSETCTDRPLSLLQGNCSSSDRLLWHVVICSVLS